MGTEIFPNFLLSAEDKLRLLSHAVSQSPVAVVITDLAGRIVYGNPHVTTTSGYTQEELIGTNVNILRSGIQPREVYEKLWATLNSGLPWRGEFANRRKDGDLFWERAAISPVRNEDGQITHYIAVKEDITAEKEAAEKLRSAIEAADAASKAKDAFLANMSHELRTPLNAINGLAQTLLEQECLPEQRASLELMRQAGQDLLVIIQDVLLFSGLQAGRVVLDSKPSSLLDLVVQAVRQVSGQARAKGLEIGFWFDPELPATIETDPMRVQQVLTHLLSNAVKFTERGRVHLAVRQRKGFGHEQQIDFTISDTGIGIEANSMSRLFQPFSQVDGSVTRRFGGAGLGLAISRSLARSLGGDISVKTRPCKGSAFTFTLYVPETNERSRVYDNASSPLKEISLALAAATHVERETLSRLLSGAGARIVFEGATFPSDLPPAVIRIDATLPPTLKVQALGSPRIGALAPVLHWPPSPEQLFRAIIDEAAAARQGTQAKEPKLGEVLPLKILAADDIRTNLETLRIMLKHLGFRNLVLVDDGQKAVEAAAENDFDLILLDLHMPRMDGITAGRSIRAGEMAGKSRAKIVALTASTLQSDRDQCFVVGMDDFLTKPVVPVALASVIRKLFADRLTEKDRKASVADSKPTAQATEPWLDLKQLEAITQSLGEEEGKAVIRALMDSLEHDIGNLIGQIDAACTKRDMEGLATLVHGLKGAALTSGWLRLGNRCAAELQLLRAGSFKNWTTWPVELRELARGSLEAWRIHSTQPNPTS